MERVALHIPAPPGFDLQLTAFSHGWYDLPPFWGDRAKGTLGCVLHLNDGRIVDTSVSAKGDAIALCVKTEAPLSPSCRAEIRAVWRTMLRCDEDLTRFHAEAQRIPRYRWMAQRGAGRLLRSPTVFEDVVKMICTTNCTWASTRRMVTAIVGVFGASSGGPERAFPSPASIAVSSEEVLRSRCSTGYRASYILDFARATAEGRLDPEEWRSSEEDTGSLYSRILTVRGLGPYAAGSLLKLLGRYDYLGLDSWVRSQYALLHHGGRQVTDRTIERAYRKYGRWRGLFFWLEMTRHWHAEKFRPENATLTRGRAPCQ